MTDTDIKTIRISVKVSAATDRTVRNNIRDIIFSHIHRKFPSFYPNKFNVGDPIRNIKNPIIDELRK